MTPASPTLAELLEESLNIPDDVYAPGQDDAFTWREDSEAAAVTALPSTATLVVMPKRTLRDHVFGVEALANLIEEMDDSEMSEQTRAELSRALIEQLAGTREKVDNVARTLGLFASLEAAAKCERERLEKREQYYARQTQRLSDYVLAVMTASNIPKLEGEISTLAKRANPASVVIDDLKAVPAEYLRHKPAPPGEPDKTAIARDLKKQTAVPGCRLATSSRLVRS